MKSVGVIELEHALSQHLHSVQQGDRVIILEDGRPVARLVPYQEEDALQVRHPLPGSPALRDVPLPPPLGLDLDVVDLLLEDRQSQR